MVTEPNEDQQRIFRLQSSEMGLENEVEQLRAEVERLRVSLEVANQLIRKQSEDIRFFRNPHGYATPNETKGIV